jgi:GTP-binding protein
MKITSAIFIKSATQPAHYPEDPYPEVAFAGKSNVGKSSLINVLVHRKKLALTSSTPGRTRLLNFFLINNRFSFVDLPGYGFARVSLEEKKNWGLMVERYLKERRTLGLVVLILDIRRDPSEDDLSLMRWLRVYNKNFIVVLTKADKVSKSRAKVRMDSIKKDLGMPVERVILFSVRTREGKTEIWNAISENPIS